MRPHVAWTDRSEAACALARPLEHLGCYGRIGYSRLPAPCALVHFHRKKFSNGTPRTANPPQPHRADPHAGRFCFSQEKVLILSCPLGTKVGRPLSRIYHPNGTELNRGSLTLSSTVNPGPPNWMRTRLGPMPQKPLQQPYKAEVQREVAELADQRIGRGADGGGCGAFEADCGR